MDQEWVRIVDRRSLKVGKRRRRSTGYTFLQISPPPENTAGKTKEKGNLGKAHLSLLTHYGMIIRPSRTVDKSLTDLTAAEEQEQEAENEHKCAAE
jgi:hypothetical protein